MQYTVFNISIDITFTRLIHLDTPKNAITKRQSHPYTLDNCDLFYTEKTEKQT